MEDAPSPLTLGVIEHALFDGAPPVTIGRFEVIRPLGRGGMGTVWLARDPELERDVAIKVHRGDRRDDTDASLRREATALARLRHRNVVTVHEVGQTASGEVFVVMEHLPGPTLRAWIEREAPPASAIVAMFVRCARGLQAAHDAGLVHRDFKPDNVVIDPDGEPRIIDFGIARTDAAEVATIPEAAGDGESTQGGALAGTPRYMAPELWSGAAPSARSDQFAFAVALFESMVGVAPFVDRRFLPRPERPRRINRRIWSTVDRALDPLPSARWPSLGELGDRLAAAITPGRSRPAIAGLAAGGIVLGAWSLWPSPPPPVAAGVDPHPCEIGVDYLGPGFRWTADDSSVVVDEGRIELGLPAGDRRFVSAHLQAPPMSFRDRAVVFELARIPATGSTNELFLTLRNAEDEGFSVLLWGGQWAFPMAPNTHGLGLEFDRAAIRFVRIQVRDQSVLHDMVGFEISEDGDVWTPIARVEGSLGAARIEVLAGSHSPVANDDAAIVRSVRCTELQPMAALDPNRDRARQEGGPPRLPE